MSTPSEIAGHSMSLDRFRALARQSQAHDALAEIPRRPRNGGWMAASFVQERLWLLEQLSPGNSAYHLCEAARISGPLDVAALERSLQCLVERHEVLRTAVSSIDGRVMQRPLPAPNDRLPIIALDAVPASRAEQAAVRIARVERALAFDLERGRVVRARLVRVNAAEHVLILTMHHTVSDLLSVRILIRDLGLCYEALSSGRQPELPQQPIHYADYAEWERDTLQGARLDRLLRYWESTLDRVEPLELPCDRPRPAINRFRGRTLEFSIRRDVNDKVKALGLAHAATPFMVYLAVFCAVLRSYASTDDVCVGVPVANRSQPGLEHLVGPLINTLVLRVDASGTPSFSELVSRVRHACVGAYAHQDLPFDKLVERLRPERDASRNPFFQVLFQHQEAQAAAPDAGRLRMASVDVPHRTAKFDVTLTIAGQGARVNAWLEFSTDLFRDATAAGIRDAFLHALDQLVARPLARIDDAALAQPQLAREPVSDAAMTCVHERLLKHALTTPDAVALVCEDDAMTYGELARQARTWANVLVARGVTSESRVVLYCDRGMPMIVGVVAVLLAGGTYVAVDPGAPRDRLGYVLADTGSSILLGTGALLGGLGAVATTMLALDEPAPEVPRMQTVPPSVENLAYVIYTSGSTGTPKGVEVEHRNVARLFDRTDAWFGFGDQDVWPLFHSLAFDVSVWEIWGALAHGGRLVVVPHWVGRSPSDFCRLLIESQATVVCQTPSAFRPLSEFVLQQPDRLPAVRTVMFAGEALHTSELQPWFSAFGDRRPAMVNMYGITETTVHSTYRRLLEADALEARGGSPIGEPIPDLGLHLLAPSMRPVPRGALGEIFVSGPGVVRGYLNRAALTAERFVPDGTATTPGARAYRSGDLARLAGDGECEYVGRLDHQVKIRGFRVELGEVEAALTAHPAVRQAVVMTERQADGDVRLIAYVVPEPGPDVSPLDLRAHAAGHLPDYMVPAGWVLLDRLPLTINGKLDRRALPAPAAAVTGAGGAYVAPSSLLEEMLCDIWKDVLGIARVGVVEDFFALGGHSLKAVQVLHRVNAALHVDLPLRALFNAPTVAATAAAIESWIGEQAIAADV